MKIFQSILVFINFFFIYAKTLFHAVIILLIIFFAVAFYLLYLGVDFIAIIILIVYIGGICVLFLSCIFILNVSNKNTINKYSNLFLVLSILGSICIFILTFNFLNSLNLTELNLIFMKKVMEKVNIISYNLIYYNFFNMVTFYLITMLLLMALMFIIVLNYSVKTFNYSVKTFNVEHKRNEICLAVIALTFLLPAAVEIAAHAVGPIGHIVVDYCCYVYTVSFPDPSIYPHGYPLGPLPKLEIIPERAWRSMFFAPLDHAAILAEQHEQAANLAAQREQELKLYGRRMYEVFHNARTHTKGIALDALIGQVDFVSSFKQLTYDGLNALIDARVNAPNNTLSYNEHFDRMFISVAQEMYTLMLATHNPDLIQQGATMFDLCKEIYIKKMIIQETEYDRLANFYASISNLGPLGWIFPPQTSTAAAEKVMDIWRHCEDVKAMGRLLIRPPNSHW